MKKIFYILILVIISLSWYLTIYKDLSNKQELAKLLEKADKYYEKGIYSDSLENYKKALKIKYNPVVLEKMIKIYINQDREYLAISNINRSNLQYDSKLKLYSKIISKLMLNRQYKTMNKIMDSIDLNKFYQLKDMVDGKYEILDREYFDLRYSPLHKNYFIVKGKKWRIIDSNNRNLIRENFDEIYDVRNNLVSGKIDKFSGLYDWKENLKAKFDDEKIYIQDEETLIKYKKNAQLVNRLGEEIFKFDMISNISKNYYVVKNETWKILDKNLDLIEDLSVQDIKFDTFNNAIINEKIIVKNSGYQIYDFKNKKFSKTYEDIGFFYDGLIAVKKFNKWGYINADFEEVIDFKYDYAHSSTGGLAIVKKDGFYKILNLNTNKEVDISENIQEIYPFNSEGITFLKINDKWKMVKLIRSIYENF